MAEHSAAVVVFEQRSEHLGAHLRFPPQRHVGGHHFIISVQVVAWKETQIKTGDNLNTKAAQTLTLRI